MIIRPLITEPGDGLGQLKTQLQAATKSIDMTMYDFIDPEIEQILADKAAQTVLVRVILDHNREAKDNQPAFNFLSSHGVQVKWAPAQYAATHAKSISIDGATTVIMTNNLDTRYYPTGRDFGIVDTNGTDIAAIAQVFAADFNDQPITPPVTPNLVWSPTQSESAILNLIDSAKSSLAIENEEMSYADIVAALGAAASRGVQTRLAMTLSKEWAANFDKLAAAGVQIVVYDPDAPLYIHAKVILADYGTASQKLFIGSQNFSYDSLDKNRELGLMVTAPAILSSVNAILAKDFQGGRLWH
jgi:phosphatidylserine/phosphatidylglycerophosphate/cardiolipin synthase-like enzyme